MNSENLTPEQQVAEEVFYDSVEELDLLKAELVRLIERVDKIKGYIAQTEKVIDKAAATHEGTPQQEINENIGKLTANMTVSPATNPNVSENPESKVYHDSQGMVHSTKESAWASDGRSA